MKKSLFIFFLLPFLAVQNANAQGWEWARNGDNGSAWGQSDAWGQSVITDAAGNIYLCGGTSNSENITFGTTTVVNPGCSDTASGCDVTLLIKYDPAGNVVWVKTAQGNGNNASLTIDKKGNIYVLGSFYSPTITFGTTTLVDDSSWNYQDIFVVKYDTAGNVLWAKSVASSGNGNDIPGTISADAFGNVYITGYFYSSAITFGATTLINDSIGTGNIFLARYDSAGNVIWAAGAGGKLEDESASVATDAMGNAYITGFFNSPAIIFGHDTLVNGGGQNMFVVKYDSTGNVIWASNPGSNDNNTPVSISTDLYGNEYVTGYFWGATSDFGVLTLSNNDTSIYTYNIFLVKYDATGNVKWLKGAVCNNYAQTTSLTNDAAGNVYIGGTTMGTSISFDNDTIPGDLFLVKYDSSGNAQWAGNANGIFSGSDYPAGITVDVAGNAYLTGSYSSWALHFGPITLIDTNNVNLFLAKFNAAYTSIPITKQTSDIFLYPNPATTSLTIQSTTTLITQITITNLLGQTIYTQSPTVNCQLLTVDVSTFPTGLYFLKINGTEVKKFVKE